MIQAVLWALYIVIAFTLVTNLVSLAKEVQKLRDNGKTPYVFRNLLTVILAAVGEYLVVLGLYTVYTGLLASPDTLPMATLFFALGFPLRNAGAYLVALAIWTVFVKVESRKMKKEVEQEKASI